MRGRELAGFLVMLAVAACRGPSGDAGAPGAADASAGETRGVQGEAAPTLTATPERPSLAELRAGDDFDEFAEHQRAAQADGARLAWENFAPIVDGKRVEWANKAELWDSIAPKIRDEALLLGPEYREPLWNTRNAIPNGISMAWNNEDTEGRGHFVEAVVTYSSRLGSTQRYWGFLIVRTDNGQGEMRAEMSVFDIAEAAFPSVAEAAEAVGHRQWNWVLGQERT